MSMMSSDYSQGKGRSLRTIQWQKLWPYSLHLLQLGSFVHLVFSSLELGQDPSIFNGGANGEHAVFRKGKFGLVRALHFGSLVKHQPFASASRTICCSTKWTLKFPQLRSGTDIILPGHWTFFFELRSFLHSLGP